MYEYEEKRIEGLMNDKNREAGDMRRTHQDALFCNITTRTEGPRTEVTIVCTQTFIDPINEQIAEFKQRVEEITQVERGELKVDLSADEDMTKTKNQQGRINQ